jgi:hypothetical protein
MDKKIPKKFNILLALLAGLSISVIKNLSLKLIALLIIFRDVVYPLVMGALSNGSF